MLVFSIIKKDLRVILSDKKALAIILVMPIILMSILSFALKGAFDNDFNLEQVTIAVVKQYDREHDRSRFLKLMRSGMFPAGADANELELASKEHTTDPETLFFHDFLDRREVSEIIDYRMETEEIAMKQLNSGAISAVVFLPENYYYDMLVNLYTPFRNRAEVQLLTSTTNSFSGQIVQAVMKAYSDSISSVLIGKNVLIETSMAYDAGESGLEGIESKMKEISAALASIEIDLSDAALEGREPVSSAAYYAAAMMTMFILFAAGHGGRMLLEEKEELTFQRMTVAGAPKLGILAGKFLTVFLIAALQMVVMIVFSSLVLGVHWGAPVSVTAIGMASAFAVAGVGAAVAAATYQAGNYKMANIFETIIIQTMALLGGSFFPIDIMPDIFQRLSVISLNGIALKALLKTMMGYGLESVLGAITILLIIGAVFAILAGILMRGKERGTDEKYSKTSIAAS